MVPRAQGLPATIEKALANIHEAAQLFLETLTAEERSSPPRQVVLTTAIEVQI